MEIKKYIVCWTVELEEGKVFTSDYKAFVDDTSEKNLENAQIEYKYRVLVKQVYSCNICEILQSTDY